MRLLIALVAWVGAVAAAAAVSSAVASSIHSSPGGSGGGGSSASGGSSFDASNVRSTDSDSLFVEKNLAKALAAANAKLGPDAQIDNAVIYPGYLDLTAVKNGSEIDYYYDASGREEYTNTGGTGGGQSAFTLARMTPDVPATLVQRIATAGNTPESQLHYIVINPTPPSQPLQWAIYTVEGNPITYFQSSGATGPLYELGSEGLQRIRG
jgi:hypothetical protein